MLQKTLRKARKTRTRREEKPGRKVLNFVENDLIKRVSVEEYKDKVRDVYGGPQGALLATCSVISLHVHLGERLFRKRQFDLTGVGYILDIGSGAGQIAQHLLRFSDPGTMVTCTDLSSDMLRRARLRLRRQYLPLEQVRFLSADLSNLPFEDGSFDCVTCGYVLEHLPDPRPGLTEMSRVLKPGGRMLLLATEDSFAGAWTSRFWCCRTYNRKDLRQICHELGLEWHKELWFTRMHKLIRAGGICVEIVRR